MLYELLFLAIGLVITFVIQNFIFPLLPPQIRNFTRYHRKKFLKRLQQQEINIELVIKTKNYEGDLTTDEVVDSLKKTLQKQFSVSFTNTSLIVDIPIGQQDTVKLQLIPIPSFENDMKFESLECRFVSKCKFSKLRTSLMHFRESQIQIVEILHPLDIPRFNNKLSLTCKLKSLHEITTLLENTHFESMDAKLSTGQKFEIGNDQIIIYDKEVSDDTIALAEKMIVLYD